MLTAVPPEDFHLDRQGGGATYLSLISRGVKFATEDSADPNDDDDDPVFSVTAPVEETADVELVGWLIDVDVTDMSTW